MPAVYPISLQTEIRIRLCLPRRSRADASAFCLIADSIIQSRPAIRASA